MSASAPNARQQLEGVIDAFEEAWLAGKKPRVEDFVARSPDQRSELLVELVFTDLEYRLRAGESSLIEDYGRRFPELKSNLDTWHSLIVEEFRLRERLGQKPSWDDYRRRFPGEEQRLGTILARPNATEAARTAAAKPSLTNASVSLPAMVKRYRVQRIVAEGGMGYVARVLDTDFDRPLAMKVLAAKFKGDAELDARFLREARLTGQLQHPGIPPVQEKGRLDDGTPFFIMKLIKGHSLHKLLRDRTSPSDQLDRFVGIFESVSQTMGYAHARGIIHRDLKPGNIMVGAFGEVQVMDWGLAKVLRSGLATADSSPIVDAAEADSVRPGDFRNTAQMLHSPGAAGTFNATQVGVVMGTPGYMAPEQARGESDAIDQRCDVFGLGAILCHILTGKPPFSGATADDRSRQSLGDLSEPFRRLDGCGADRDLIDLAKRCLAPLPRNRPADAQAVADAVAKYQQDVQLRLKHAELEQARLLTRAQEEKKRRRDRRILGGAIIALIALTAMAGWMVKAQSREATKAAAARISHQIDGASTLVDFSGETLLKGDYNDTRRTLSYAKLVADDAIKNQKKEEANLDAADLRDIDARFADYDARRAAVDKNLTFAEKLQGAFERRGALHENDFDARTPSVIVFGQTGPDSYRGAFSHYGVDVEADDPADAAKKLASFPLREALGLAFADWMIFEGTRPLTKRLFALAEAADPDGDRSLLRQGILKGDAKVLIQLSNDLAVDRVSSVFVVLLADALHRLGKYDEALLLLDRAYDQRPGEFWINDAHGVFLLALRPQRAADAVARFEAQYVLRPKEAFVTTNLASAYVADFQLGRAERVCRRYLAQIDSSNPMVRATLAGILLRQGKDTDAELILGEGLKTHRNSGFLQAGIADVYLQRREFEKARELGEKVYKQYPGFSNALVVLGCVDNATGRSKSAIATGDVLISGLPRSATGYIIAGQGSLQLGDLKAADDYIRNGLKIDPRNAGLYSLRGDLLFRKGDFRGGFEAYQKAAEFTAGPLGHYLDAAAALANAKLPSEAGWLYAEILKRDLRNKQAWSGLETSLQITRDGNAIKRQLGPAFARLSTLQRTRIEQLSR